MATEAQIRANRANAKKSCGPKTDAGKSRSRLNSLKHGARAEVLNPVLPRMALGFRLPIGHQAFASLSASAR